MPPASLARAKSRAKVMMAEMLLAEIRKNVGMTQEDLASPHPTTKILHVRIGCGPPDVEENLKKGIRPAANHNAKFKVELPTIAAGTKADVMVLMEFLKKH
jgi:hypothetical protein